MTLHAGRIYGEGNVSLRPPDLEALRLAPLSPDVADSLRHWLFERGEREDVYYFSIYLMDEVIGQIFLHDQDDATGESLVGYHLFQPEFRGRGAGTVSLSLLQQFVREETTLKRLVSLTSPDNRASWRIAQKCGFRYNGQAREGPGGVVHIWDVPEPR